MASEVYQSIAVARLKLIKREGIMQIELTVGRCYICGRDLTETRGINFSKENFYDLGKNGKVCKPCFKFNQKKGTPLVYGKENA